MKSAGEWELRRYGEADRSAWNDFTQQARQASFLFLRDYMDYEVERFADHSLMAYRRGRLEALLPACLQGDALCSHNGLTYGGWLTRSSMGTAAMLSLMQALCDYVAKNLPSVHRVVYRAIPYIYHDYPSDEDLYALWRMGARLIERKVSSALPLARPLSPAQLRRRGLHKAQRAGLSVAEDERFDMFWPVLEQNLAERHAVRPVHTLAEIEMLHARLPEHIRLFRVCSLGGETLGGSVLYCHRNVVHAQYIASTALGRQSGALDLLFITLLGHSFWGARFFDFGNSVEHGGQLLNEGLISQKEGFGGRAICYDTYEWTL